MLLSAHSGEEEFWAGPAAPAGMKSSGAGAPPGGSGSRKINKEWKESPGPEERADLRQGTAATLDPG